MAAGIGNRLSSIWQGPKCLLEIGGKAIIDHQLDCFRAAGYKNIVVVVGHQAERVKDHLKKRSEKFEFVLNPFYRVTNVLASFWFACEKIRSRDLLYAHGDTVFDPEIVVRLNQSRADIALSVDPIQVDEEAMKVKVSSGRVTAISKKLDLNQSYGEFVGVMRIRSGILPRLKEHVKNLIVDQQYHQFFEAAVEKIIEDSSHSVEAVSAAGCRWREIDTPEDHRAAVRMFGRDR